MEMELPLVLAGIALLVTGILLALAGREQGERASSSGVILIVGPIPIIIGKNIRVVKELVLLAIALFLLAVILPLIVR